MTIDTDTVLHRWQTRGARRWYEITACENGTYCVASEYSASFCPTVEDALQWAQESIAYAARIDGARYKKTIG